MLTDMFNMSDLGNRITKGGTIGYELLGVILPLLVIALVLRDMIRALCYIHDLGYSRFVKKTAVSTQ